MEGQSSGGGGTGPTDQAPGPSSSVPHFRPRRTAAAARVANCTREACFILGRDLVRVSAKKRKRPTGKRSNQPRDIWRRHRHHQRRPGTTAEGGRRRLSQQMCVRVCVGVRVWARAWACLGGVGCLLLTVMVVVGTKPACLAAPSCARHRLRRLGKRTENPQAANIQAQVDNRGTERSAACHLTQRRQAGLGGFCVMAVVVGSPKTRRFVEVQMQTAVEHARRACHLSAVCSRVRDASSCRSSRGTVGEERPSNDELMSR